MSKFDIYTRRMGDRPWRFYGTFSSGQEFRDELPNITMLGLAVQRRKHRSAPTAVVKGAGTPAGSPQSIPAGALHYGGWLGLAAERGNVKNAVLLICSRLSIDPYSEAVTMSMPDNDHWERMTTYDRMGHIKIMLMRVCNEIGEMAEMRRLNNESTP